MTRPTLAGSAVAVALLTVLVACSSSGLTPERTALAAAMDSVSGSGPASTYFEFGDLAAMRRLHMSTATGPGTGKPAQRWQRIVGLGSSQLAQYSRLLPQYTALRIFAADRAVTIGQPPNTAIRLDGAINAAAIRRKLVALGAKPRAFGDTTGLSFGADNSVHLNSPLASELYLVNQLDQVVVDKHRFAASPNAATIEKALDGGKSLLATGDEAKLADCLGDVIAAVIVAPTKDARTTLIGVGYPRPASATGVAHEVLCADPAAGQQQAVRDAFKRQLAPSATDPARQVPLRSYVSSTAVPQAGSMVQAVLTLRDSAPVGYLLAGLVQNLYRVWDGSCTATQFAHRQC